MLCSKACSDQLPSVSCATRTARSSAAFFSLDSASFAAFSASSLPKVSVVTWSIRFIEGRSGTGLLHVDNAQEDCLPTSHLRELAAAGQPATQSSHLVLGLCQCTASLLQHVLHGGNLQGPC